MLSVQQLQTNLDAALSQWRLEVERTHYEAERRYRAVSRETALLLAAWEPTGIIACGIWPPPKQNCAAASDSGPIRLAPSNSTAFRCSAPIFVKSGHHGSRRQGTPANAAGRSDPESQTNRRLGAPDSALARRSDYRAGCPCFATQADGTAHRRRYDLTAAASACALSGRSHRGNLESSGPQDSYRRTLHRQSGRQSATIPQHPVIPAIR